MSSNVSVRLEVAGVAEAIADIRRFVSQAKGALADVTKSASRVDNTFGGIKQVLGGLGIAVGLAEIARFTKETIDAALEQKHLSEMVGTTVGHMSALSAVASIVNTDSQKLSVGLGTLARNLDKVKTGAAGSDAVQASLKRLGLTIRDVGGNDTVVSFGKIAAALAKVADGTSKTAIAADLMGRNGRALLPLAEKLSMMGGLTGATAFAKSTGFFIDEHGIAQFERLNEQIQSMALLLKGAATQFIEGFGPGVTAGLQILFSTVSSQGVSSFKALGTAIGDALRTLGVFSAATILTFDDFYQQLLGRQTVKDAGQRAYREGLGRGLPEDLARDAKQAAIAAETARQTAAAKDRAKMVDDLLKQIFQHVPEGADGPAVAPLRLPADPESSRRAADAAARERLSQQKQYEDAELTALRAFHQKQEDADADAYKKGDLSFAQYLANRKARIIQDYRFQTDRLSQDKKALTKATDPDGLVAGAIDTKISALANQMDHALHDAGEGIETLDKKVKTLREDLRGAFQASLAQFLGSGINKVHDLTDAIRQLGLAIAQAVQQAVAMKIATTIANKVFGPAIGFAEGGYVTGPGGPTADRIPAMLSAGEYVVPARVVSHPGVLAMLEGMRGKMLTPEMLQTPRLLTPRQYAAGGLVTAAAPAAGGRAAGEVHVHVHLDDSLSLQRLDTHEGHRQVIKVFGKNKNLLRTMLGN